LYVNRRASSTDDGSLISHSFWPVAVVRSANMKSSVPPTNVRPLAVRMTPPELGRPGVRMPGGRDVGDAKRLAIDNIARVHIDRDELPPRRRPAEQVPLRIAEAAQAGRALPN